MAGGFSASERDRPGAVDGAAVTGTEDPGGGLEEWSRRERCTPSALLNSAPLETSCARDPSAPARAWPLRTARRARRRRAVRTPAVRALSRADHRNRAHSVVGHVDALSGLTVRLKIHCVSSPRPGHSDRVGCDVCSGRVPRGRPPIDCSVRTDAKGNRATFARSWRTLASPLTPAGLVVRFAGGGQVGSGASQGIAADTQWVIGWVWSLLWRWRGGWAKVA